MSVTFNEVDQNALDSTHIGVVEFSKELASKHTFQFLDVGRVAMKVSSYVLGAAGKVFGLGLTAVSGSFASIATGLGGVAGMESFVFFTQGVVEVPTQMVSLKDKIVEWRQGSASAADLANRSRKVAAHFAGTVGDYNEAICAAETLGVANLPGLGTFLGVDKLTGNRIGWISTTFAAISRLYDYSTGDVSHAKLSLLDSNSEKVRRTFEDSRNWWLAVRDVSITTTALACLFIGASSAVVSLGTVCILGTKLASYYAEAQEKAFVNNSVNMINAKKAIKPQPLVNAG